MISRIEVRKLEHPDDALDMKERGGINVVKMSDGTSGMHAVFEPGWTWEKDEKPLLGSLGSCPMRHTALLHRREAGRAHGRDRHGNSNYKGRLLRDSSRP
jgi:hypothetical protein